MGLCGLDLIFFIGYGLVQTACVSRFFLEVVGLERGPPSLVSAIEELLERESSGSGPQIREYGRRDPSTLTTLHPLSARAGTCFGEKRRSLVRYSSLADSGHGVLVLRTSAGLLRTR
jgi:hypothetical protein